MLRIVDCIDRERTIGELWTEEDGDTDEVGGYRIVFELWLDPDRIGDVQIFRPAGWLLVMAVTEEVKLALEDAGVSGLTFQAISTVGSAST